MNAMQVNTPAVLPVSKWSWRHKRFRFNFNHFFWMLLGILPGIGIFVVTVMLQKRAMLTPLETTIFITVGFSVIGFGALIGLITGSVLSISEKICFPEDTNSKTTAL